MLAYHYKKLKLVSKYIEKSKRVYICRENVPSPPESTTTSSVASSPSLSTFDEIVTSKQTDIPQESGPSFAEMLRNTGTRLKSQTVWPSINSNHGKPYSSMTIQSSSKNTEEEDYVSVPSYSQSFGDALAAALEQTKLGK